MFGLKIINPISAFFSPNLSSQQLLNLASVLLIQTKPSEHIILSQSPNGQYNYITQETDLFPELIEPSTRYTFLPKKIQTYVVHQSGWIIKMELESDFIIRQLITLHGSNHIN
jgi:hypothetical protein